MRDVRDTHPPALSAGCFPSYCFVRFPWLLGEESRGKDVEAWMKGVSALSLTGSKKHC